MQKPEKTIESAQKIVAAWPDKQGLAAAIGCHYTHLLKFASGKAMLTAPLFLKLAEVIELDLSKASAADPSSAAAVAMVHRGNWTDLIKLAADRIAENAIFTPDPPPPRVVHRGAKLGRPAMFADGPAQKARKKK